MSLPVGVEVAAADGSGSPRPEITGRDITLRRPDPADAAALYPATHGSRRAEEVWTYLAYGPWRDAAGLASWIGERISSADPYWWTVTWRGNPVGMAALMSRDPAARRAEIGHIWYVPEAQRTTANTEAAYLMLSEGFDRLACRRMEWKCDALNQRSRDAALRLGFTFEGVFRNHMIVKGRNRDTAWYSITDTEWVRIGAALEEWLYRTPRDDAGRPTQPLAGLR
ncbi:MAG TPA: GNAT family protein [Acidimicrobiia bacterium]|nr:GNAT family protein [Acidimicrobiia bacterium]